MAILRAAAVLVLLLPAAPLGAQEEEGWAVEGEVGASLFFGNTEQATVTTRTDVERTETSWEFSLGGGFSYGEAQDDEGIVSVIKRSWEIDGSVDYEPFERWHPFVFGKVESSLEKQIDLRYDGGAGATYTVLRDERTRFDLSVALLAERTRPRVESEAPDTTLARWSTRLRARRSWADDRLTVSSESVYRPQFRDFENYIVTSRSSLAFQLTEVVSLKLTFVDNYDSEAVARGARENNDGQLFFSVLSQF